MCEKNSGEMDNSEKPSPCLHDSLHSSRTLQRCKICKKSFRHPDIYIAHLSLHKKATAIQKARLYVCGICASSHRGLSAFLEHQKFHVSRVSTASISSKRIARVSDGNDETAAILTAAADTGGGTTPLIHDGGTSVASPTRVSVSREGIHNLNHQYGSALAWENSSLSNVRSNMSVSSAMSLVAVLCSVNNPLLGHSHTSSMLGAPMKPGSSDGIQIEIPTQVKTIHLSKATPSLADVVKLINLLSNKIDALIKHFQVPVDEDGNLVALEAASIEIENKEIHDAQNENDPGVIEGYPPSYSVIQAAKEQQQQEYYALALGQQSSLSSLRLEIPDSPAEGKQQAKNKGVGKTIDLWIPPTSQYFSTLPVIVESNSPDSVEAQNYLIPQSVIEKVFLESRSRGNFAKNLLFAICSPEERRGKNCSGRVYGKATPKGRLDQGKLNAVKEVTMRKYPCHTSLVDITWKKECVTAIDSGLRNENRLSRTSEHGPDNVHDHHLQAVHAIESDSSKMQDLPAGQMDNEGASQSSLAQSTMAQSAVAPASVVRTSPVNGIELKDEKMDAENLKRIKWSQKSLSLSAFVDKYPLPQIVQVEEGYYGGRDDNSLSAGQVLKIHLLSSERKILCIDRHDKEVHIPLFTKQRVILRPVDYDVVYQTVAELAKEKPLPPFVEVTRGYYNVNSNVKYELSVEPGEKLRVLHDDSGGVSKADKKIKHMSFKNRDGVDIKIPFDCIAGFKPLLHLEPQNLADVVASNPFPFRVEFVPDSSLEVSDGPGILNHKLGVLECTELYDEELIIASCGYDELRVVFTIPRNLKVTVKLAIGTLNTDPEYDLIRRSYHNFANLEENVARERSSKFFRSSGEIEGFSLASAFINSPLVAVPEDRIIQDIRISEPSRSATSEGSSHVQQDASGVLKGEADIELATSKVVAKATDVVKAGLSTSSSASLQSKFSPLPERIDELSVNQVAVCLRSLNLGKHEGKFRFNQIDGALLAVLDDDALKDLQLNSFERKKILSFIKGWRPHKE